MATAVIQTLRPLTRTPCISYHDRVFGAYGDCLLYEKLLMMRIKRRIQPGKQLHSPSFLSHTPLPEHSRTVASPWEIPLPAGKAAHALCDGQVLALQSGAL